MKLLNKINRTYVLSSLLVTIPGLIIAYFFIIFTFNEETSEILRGNEKRVVQQIRTHHGIPSFYPLTDVEKTEQAQPFVLKDTTIFNSISKENEAFKEYTTYRIINHQTYRITVRTPVIEKNDVVLSLFLGTTFLFLLIVSVLFLINKYINRSIWLSFYTNLNTIKSFSLQSNEKLTLQPSNISEFSDLNHQLMRLTDKVISDYNNLKEFTENASHELQTPLSVVQAKVETLFNSNNINKDQVVVLETVLKNIQRLNRLNQSLLLLTKIENDQFNAKEDIIFNELILQTLDMMKEMFDQKGITIHLNQKEDFIHKMDPILARQLIHNLMANIIFHTPEKGTAVISIDKDSLSFVNDGEKALDSNRVFERFYKASHNQRSTGLGLAIVKKICTLNQLDIRYMFVQKAHHFTLYKQNTNTENKEPTTSNFL